MSLRIEKIQDLPLDNLDDLLWESKRTGFNAVQRLITNWASGANRFDCPGEAFFIAWRENCMVGVCGLNVDPYANSPHIGRVRHLYVTLAHRRQGIGRALVKQVITVAQPNFAQLHVRTYSQIADRFYRSLGFTPCHESGDYSHRLILRNCHSSSHLH